jgi:hypothetical protein
LIGGYNVYVAGAAYAITGYTCSLTTSTGGGGSACGNYEIGTTGSNPSFTGITYSVTGTNGGSFTDSASHTGTFASPWTSAAITATYGTGSQINFYLTADNSTASPTSASVSNDFNPTLYCIFAGAGGSSGTGATSSGSGTCTAGETATITGASVTTILPSVRLGATYAGETFVITLSGQNAVLLLDGGCGHSLTVNTTPTTFNTHATTLTNILGGSQTGMCIYTSPSTGTGTFTIGVTS